jgi:5-methylcytosine-specific restriction endonuclease McrA
MGKESIPKALREQVWLRTAGKRFEIKCPIRWCKNRITAFEHHIGHNKPEAAGGTLHIDNLIAICARCNLSMGSQFTIDQWQLIVKTKEPGLQPRPCRKWWRNLLCQGTPIAPLG